MNNVLHTKESLKSIIIKYFIALIPLIIYGFYKNGVLLYTNHLTTIKGLFKPLVFVFSGVLIGIIVNYLYERIIKKHQNINNKLLFSFESLYGALVSSVISINTNYFLFIGVTFVILFISKFLKKNYVNITALIALLIVFISNIIGSFSFLNMYERTNTFNLNTLDYLIGRGSGGINTTCIFLLIISLIILFKIKSYKKEIPLFSIISYSLCIIIYSIITNDLGHILDNIFTNGIIFSFIFIAPDYLSSCYTKKGKVIFGILAGLFTFGLYLIYPPLSALGGILIVSLSHYLIDHLCELK